MEDTREFPSTFHRHYLDDPTFDFAVDDSEGGNYGAALAHLILVAITILGWHYKPVIAALLAKPPTMVQQTVEAYGIQWELKGVKIDGANHTLTCTK